MAVEINLRFDGLYADDHQLDMRRLGQSLIGLDRVVNESLFLAIEGRLATGRERLPLVVRVQAPHAACFDVPAVVATAAGVLPLILEMLKHPGTKFLFEFLSFLLKWRGGKRVEADGHLMEAFRTLAEIHQSTLEDHRTEREVFYANEERWREFSILLADRMARPLKEVVAPIGGAAETLTLSGPPGVRPTVIDVPMAEAVRSREPLETGEMETLTVHVDGITLHNRMLKVELPDQPGSFINAEVRDPAFDNEPNPYKEAVGGPLIVQAKASRRLATGELVKLYIMDHNPAPRTEAA